MNRNSLGIMVALVVSATQVYASTSVTPKIINGTEATLGDWPFMTAVINAGEDAYNGQFCGGSFIGGRYVLTASHCVADVLEADSLEVIVGINDLSNEASEGTRVGVQAIYMNEDYDAETTSNDIAILELESEVTATSIGLATGTLVDGLASGDTVTVIGWGGLNYPATSFPTVLNQVDLPYVDRSTCQNLGGSYISVGEDAICAGYINGGYDSCQGDSGGPLLYNNGGTYTQIGVVSWGNGCALADAYGVYSNVGYFSDNDWITQKISGVSYTQITRQRETSGILAYTLPIRNYGTEIFSVTDIEVPSGMVLASNNCSAALEENDSCSFTVWVDAEAVYNAEGVSNADDLSLITVSTDSTAVSQFLMAVMYDAAAAAYTGDLIDEDTFNEAANPSSSSDSSGGAALYLGLLAALGLLFRLRRT